MRRCKNKKIIPNRYLLAKVLFNKYGAERLGVKSFKEAADKFFPKDSAEEKLHFLEAGEIIKDAVLIGGVIILAHPGEKGLYEDVNQLKETILRYASVHIDGKEYMGIQGMEIYSSKHSSEQVKEFKEIQSDLNRDNRMYRYYPFISTIGSDDHGDRKDIKLGRGSIKESKAGNLPSDARFHFRIFQDLKGRISQGK